ncbi:MAG: FAD-containing oxidoreductase [Alphaproteobacteria bacterium]|nr:FAD-containing oxidoreductase [Alphaproteobacteria bacterium]
MAEQFDAIVIGTGQAGSPLAARLADAGMTVAVIERGKFGGTCVNTGCIPTKTLVASARAAHVARHAGEFGVRTRGAIQVDMKKVKARLDRIAGGGSAGIRRWMKGTKGVTVIKGHARFTGPKTVAVKDRTLTAERIFINVGGRALVPDMPGLEDVPYLTNSTMLAVDFLPRHLVVIGGSYIGLEFAQMYRRFGSRVTVVEKGPRLIGREDPEVSAAVKTILEAEGIAVRLDAECLSVKPRGKGVAVSLDCRRGGRTVAGSHLLMAVGRVPNTQDLGLEAAGVAVDKRGYITVDDRLRTNVPGVWALGDCNGRGAFTHTSYNDYEIVAENLLDGAKRRISDRIPAYALYIDPPLGRAGMNDAEARKSGRKVLAGRLDMRSIGRARERSETAGFLKILVDADSRRILGVSLLGIEADEVMQSLLGLMYADQPYTLIQRAMYIHPTVSEYLPTLVGDLEPLE